MSDPLIVHAAHFLAVGLAALLAWRSPSPRQRAIAWALAALLFIAILRRLCLPSDIAERLAARQAGAAPPAYAGLARWAWAIGQTAGRAWHVTMAWTVWASLSETRAEVRTARALTWLAGGTVTAVVIWAHYVTYPAIRGDGVAAISRLSFALSLTAQFVAALRFFYRGKWPDDAQRVALILAASSLADAFGPWLVGNPARDWYAGHLPALLTWAAIAAWEAKCLIVARRHRG